jgi:hypothetical protein
MHISRFDDSLGVSRRPKQIQKAAVSFCPGAKTWNDAAGDGPN